MKHLPVQPAGSYGKFLSLGLDESYLPVWLQVGSSRMRCGMQA